MLDVLIVDDERDFRELLHIILKRNGIKSTQAKDGFEAIERLKEKKYDVVLTDLMMDGCDGMALLGHISEYYPNVDTIIMTAYGSIENAVEAIKMGAFSYFIKSNDPQEILFDLKKIEKIRNLSVENQRLKDSFIDQGVMLESNNVKFVRALDYAKRAADSDSNILILGESGVGKEIFAQYIHQNSPRYQNVFMPVNCYSFADALIESELYGHERGAFTGATDARVGRFEAADQGTLFLDEVGDLPESTQIKILRNLENREITKIGSNKTVRTNFRLISATHKDLKKAIQESTFREDLFYRLSTVIIEIPPLRERVEDIPLLVDYFVRQAALEMKKPIQSIEPALRDALYNYDYPGNIREMKNIIERIVVLSVGGILRMDEGFKLSPLDDGISSQSLRDVRQAAEKRHIKAVLQRCEQNYKQTAEILELSVRQLYNKCNEYGIGHGI